MPTGWNSGLCRFLERWLRIFDFTDPVHPVQLGEFDPSTLGFDSFFLYDQRVIRVRAAGNLVYLANGAGGLQIIDVTVPAQPVRVGGYNGYGVGFAYDIQFSGTRAYVAAGSLGLDVLDISDPGNLVRLGRFPRAGTTSAIALVGDRALIGGTGPLQIVDVRDPANMRLIKTVTNAGAPLQIVGTRAFVRGLDGMEVYDIGNLDDPIPSS
jgi:hypothetical protein